MKKNKTYIIIPTWNNSQYTICCFGSVAKCTDKYKIIWIDNGSDIEEKTLVANFLKENNIPHIAIFNNENKGFVKAINQGLRMAIKDNVKNVVLLNNDVEVYDEWLDRMLFVVEKNDGIGIVGPLASPSHGWQDINTLRNSRPDEFFDLPTYNHSPSQYSGIIAQKYNGQSIEVYPNVAFFCTLITKKVIDDVGILSEDFGLGFGDDDDYCSRTLDCGYTIHLAKDVFVLHNHRTTFKKYFSNEQVQQMKKNNKKILIDKHKRYRILLDDDIYSKSYGNIICAVFRKSNILTFPSNLYDVYKYKYKHRNKNFIK